MLLQRIGISITVLAVAYGATVMFLFPRALTVDDAFITFRYAENLALHDELNWNVGENPVEGFTGILLPLLVAGSISIGVSPINASHAIGVLSFWVGFLMLFLIGRRLRYERVLTASVMLLYVTTPILYTHAWSGMETMLFIALALSSLFAFLARKDKTLLILLLLISLTRPEGVAFAVLAMLSVGWTHYRTHDGSFRRFLQSALLIYIVPAAAYFLWRWNYYGRLLPNTFYAKSDVGFEPHTLVDIARFLRRYLAVPFLGALLFFAPETDRLFETLRRFWRERTGVVAIGLGMLFSLAVVAVLSRTHLIMNFSHRFYTMLLPISWVLLLVLFHIGFSSVDTTKSERPLRFRFLLCGFLVLIGYQVLFQAVKIRDEFTFANRQILMQRDVHTRIGKTLHEILDPKETVISYMDAGAVSYFSKLRVIDFGALNDEYLARHGTVSDGERVEYFFSEHPGAVVFTSEQPEKVVYGAEADRIMKDPRFASYALYQSYAPEEKSILYYEFVFVRKDLLAKIKNR